MPTVKGWRTETLRFPLPFAPGLSYRGVEELRFAPGMFKAKSPELWTYSFAWWLEGAPSFTSAQLNADLQTYLAGLVQDEGAVDNFPVTSKLREIPRDTKGHAQFAGLVESFDPFATHRPILLNVRVDVFQCQQAARTVAFFRISPQPVGHPVWAALKEVLDGFECTN